MLKILLVDNHDSFTFNLVQVLQSVNHSRVDVKKINDLKLHLIKNYDKIVISPGPGLPSDYPLLKEIISEHSKNIPVLGVCLGHQAIATAFGASLIQVTPVSHGIVAKINILNRSCPIFLGFPQAFDAGLYHSWAVSQISFPENLEITAVSEKGIIMAIKHRKYDINGIQFHPESIMTPLGKQLLSNWVLQ